jgi:hypothetical protein
MRPRQGRRLSKPVLPASEEDMANNPFTRHPHDLGESYLHHFVNASAFGLRMLAGGCAAIIHSVFPFLFVHTGSRTMEKLHRRMTRRAVKADWERHPII